MGIGLVALLAVLISVGGGLSGVGNSASDKKEMVSEISDRPTLPAVPGGAKPPEVVE